jgi:RimJ/RimL family protein N-acetyltransferase
MHLLQVRPSVEMQFEPHLQYLSFWKYAAEPVPLLLTGYNHGIATFLLKFLITIAKRNGIAGFTAEVLRNNKPMMAVFDKSGCKINTITEENVYSYELDFV